MAASLAALVFAASCSKAEIEVNPEENGVGETYQGPTRTLTFNVTIGETQTKTHLATEPDQDGSYPVLWDAQDEVKVIWGKGGSDCATGKITDAATGLLEVEVPADVAVDYYYAVYPANTAYVLDAETGKLTISMPETTGTFKTANMMVARCASDDRVFGFRHAVGIVRLQMGDNSFAENGTISRFGLYSGTRSFVTGKVQCTFGENDEFSAQKINETRYRYSRANNLTPGQEVYLAVWPDYTFEEGFIAYYFNEQRSAYYESDVTVARGQILNLGNVQDRMRTDFFIKPNGIGDGSSWENAAGEDFIRSFFAKKEDSDRAYAHCQKCENTNFWFAAGTYVLGTEDAPKFDLYWGNAAKDRLVPICFYGGCAATGGTDKTRDPETYQTIFSGDSKYGILSVRNKADLTLDGITLRDAVITSDLHAKDGSYGAALYVSMDTSVSNKDEGYFPVVRVNNCKFIDNKEESGLNGDFGCGSAINLATGKVYVDNTLFSGNVSYNRGMIHAAKNDVQAGTCLFMNNCRFTGNSLTADQYGIVIRSLNVNTKVALNGCSFGKNSPNDRGAAPVCISSPCVFVNNTVIEDASNTYGSNAGIYRMASVTNTEAVLANNIIMDESNTENSFLWTQSSKTDGPNFQFKSLSNLCGPQQSMEFGCVLTDLSDNSTGAKTTKIGTKTTDLNGLSWSESLNHWTWDGNVDGFTYATAAQVVAATKANSIIGDDFYNWLVKIGAIVNGQFTDCRGYLRQADKMCPGAYDPFATSSVSVE